jgi:hypothetical protein
VISNLIKNSSAIMFLLKVAELSKPSTAYVLSLDNSFGKSLLIARSLSNIIVAQNARETGANLAFKELRLFRNRRDAGRSERAFSLDSFG